MRTNTKLQDIQIALFQLRQSRGQYLKDVPYEDLRREEIANLATEARYIHYQTKFDLRRVKRDRRQTWRFLDRN